MCGNVTLKTTKTMQTVRKCSKEGGAYGLIENDKSQATGQFGIQGFAIVEILHF
ncbi:hypothetical protein Calow_1655 [Caldicellulosiruptor owensensis OL]|uniref:Uncharacterized protein n=1 Tax=Caldicellulosiruptor owensensis (strain ATCC 700167 / DSM 13100 / OL) TaxID=632518 RepID=E4Q447_CALOW|nr:hypothetical protein [Caldicellulosiruptor owensensis]ADQ05201.1 hypothetical protein Calow_1655 [Caldicellulosiruptor owensensis OL]